MGFRLSSPVILVYGAEEFFLDRDLQSLKGNPRRDVVLLDGHSVTEAEVVSACESVSIDFTDPDSTKPRLVLLDNAHKVKLEKIIKAYVEGRDSKDTSSVLVAFFRTEKLPPTWSKLKSIATHHYEKLKTWDNNNQVVEWAKSEAKRIGLDLDERVAKALFHLTGGNLYRINNELGKLLLLVGKGRADITHLKLVGVQTAGSDPWAVVDAALLKKPKAALSALNSLYRFATDDPSILLLGSLAKGVEKAFVARSLLDRGCQSEDVAARLGMHPYRYHKSVHQQASKHSTLSLAKMMQTLSELDVRIKRTSHRRTMLELAVLELSS